MQTIIDLLHCDWPAYEQRVETMVAGQSQMSDGIYMTEDQYLVLDEATDGKYKRLNGMVTMLRPPSSHSPSQTAA